MSFADENVFYPTVDVLALDHVANAQLFPAKDNDASEKILEDILEREADRHGGQSKAGNNVGGRHRRKDDRHRDGDADNPRGNGNEISCQRD